MALLDRLRRRPRWEDPDPKVRAEAVREIPSSEQDRVVQMAREDPDAHVRRAAVRRVSAVDVLARIAADDADAGVREKAAETLVAHASGPDEATAVAAAALLSEPRHLLALALSAAVPAVRSDAVGRLRDARALVRIARTASDPALRLQAVAGVADPPALVEIASRIEDPGALRSVAGAARNKAAARRARERARELRPAEEAVAPAEEAVVAAEEAAEAADAQADDHEPAAAPDEGAGEVSVETDAAMEQPSTTDSIGAAGPEGVPPQEPAPPAASEASAEAPAMSHEEPAAEPTPHEGHDEGGEAPEAAAAPAAAPAGPRLRPDRREKLAQAEALCARLSAIAEANPFVLRDADVALREARLPHDDVTALPPKLARRLKEARAALFARAQEAREAEEWRRWGNATVQEELCRRLESLGAREDLEQVARDLRSLDDRWAEVRTAPRGEAETLRQRYQAARAPLKEKIDAYFAAKAAREAENLRLKEELAARAEALADSTDWLKASEELKTQQARWKEIGPAPRRQADAVWKRFRAACDRFFARRQEDLKKRKHEWAANMARKQELCTRAEALAESSDWEAAAAEVRRLQAEWKTVGPVRRDRSEAVWQRFRKACDAFFDRYKHRDELERLKRVAEREAVAAELEALSAGAVAGSPAPANLVEEVQRLMAKARQGPALPAADEEKLLARLSAARDRAVSAWPEAFRGTDLDPEAGRARREKLCARVEALVSAGEAPAATLSGAELARRLKEALATNTMGGRAEAEARKRAEADEVKAAQAAWRRLAPLPGDEGQAFEHRFRSACDRFFRQRPSPSSGESRAR